MKKEMSVKQLNFCFHSEPRIEKLFKVDGSFDELDAPPRGDTRDLESLSKIDGDQMEEDSVKVTSDQDEETVHNVEKNSDSELEVVDSRTVGVVIGVLLTVISILIGGILYVSHRGGAGKFRAGGKCFIN